MPYPGRAYLFYVDDSGNESQGWLWTALGHPVEQWSEHLRRWLAFRRWLFRKHGVPASFELHAQAWLSPQPSRHTEARQLRLVSDGTEELVPILRRARDARRLRFEVFEKALKTIGSLPDATLFTTHTPESTGEAKSDLYHDLLSFIERFLESDRAHGTLIVDGLNDGGGHLRKAHRSLLIDRRRITEDPSHRSSADSQLLQMADLCAYAALQSIQGKATLDPRFRSQYENALSRIIERPAGVGDGRCIRGYDYPGDRTGYPSELMPA